MPAATPSPPSLSPSSPLLHTLASGVRLVVLPMPHGATVTAAVFIASGSQDEAAAEAGISHAVEHMVFKGTAARNARAVNLDAERLGAEVNAHTDKDHTAFHVRGLPQHLPQFLRLLAELVQQPTFPPDELEREREVLLHEFAEDDDDPLATAFKLYDRACWGSHALSRPVIGSRRTLERVTRDELVRWVHRRYTAGRTVVAVAGPVPAEAVQHEVEAAFAAMARSTGPAEGPAPPVWHGGVASRRIEGCSQAHLVLGFPIAGRTAADAVAPVAAAVLGEGMSSPLLERLREQRGLAYYAACSADVLAQAGQFTVELSTSAAQLEATLQELARLLPELAGHIDPVDLERARNQIAVRHLRTLERPLRRLEDAALEVFAHGRLPEPGQRLAEALAVDADALRAHFARLHEAGAALALAGQLPRAASVRAQAAFAPLLRA